MSINIVGVGSRGPLGLNSLQVAMCARAHKIEPRSVEHLLDARNQEVGVCLSGGLSLRLYGYARMVALAVPAISEAVYPALKQMAPNDWQLPVVLSLPEASRPDDDPRFNDGFIQELKERSGLPLDSAQSTTIRSGHAGGALALARAKELLAEGHAAVIVGGVDSYYHPEVLRWLDADYRLHALNVDDGMTPSESAAFALLMRADALPKNTPAPTALAELLGVYANEEKAITEDEPNAAEAVTELLALAKGEGPVHWLFCDVNGERHRVKEWSFAAIRHRFQDDVVVERVPDELGDVGAASGATMLSLACELWRRGCGAHHQASVLLSSEGSERGLFTLRSVS